MLEHIKQAISDKQACVVWLGGSLTEGEGASAPCFCWQALLSEWMKEKYPSCSFTCLNRGIGGTNSEFGLYRLHRDVLQNRPDLLFVEFAVNDYGRAPEKIREDMEGIVENTLEAKPDTDIILVLNTTVKMAEENYDRGAVPESVRIHQETADRYCLPVIRVGEQFLELVRNQGRKRTDLLPDQVHPNDRGYRVYFEIIRKAMESFLSEDADDGRKRIQNSGKTADMLNESRFSERKRGLRNARLVNALKTEAEGFRLLASEGFREERIALCGREKGYISSNVPGSRLELSFFGSSFGLVWMIASDSGRISCSIDGGEKHCLSSWDPYAKSRERINHKMLADELPESMHTVRIEVEETHDPESSGTFIRIGDWLIG